MNKLRYLEHFGPIPDYGDELTLFHAFVGCLSPEEAIRAIDIDFEQEYRKRAVILRKITRDMQSDFRECHTDLVKRLLSVLPTLKGNKRQSCGHLLSEFYALTPSSLQRNILHTFIDSTYVGLRRRGYKILRYKWDSRFAKSVEKAWRRYLDAEATRLIIDRFSTEFLRDNFQLICDSAETSWNLRRLYLRATLHDLKLLKQLRTTDEISYVYVAAKIKHRVTSREALAIFNRHLHDTDAGLLIWSFGQLGLWQVLDNIRTRLNEIEGARFAKMMATSGTT